MKEQLADVSAFTLLPAGKHGLDEKENVQEKINKNEKKYPAEKEKGTARKYYEL